MKPYFKTGDIEIYQGDCLEVMPGLEDQSFDFICVDLPYGVTACDWDKKLPLDKLWEQWKRLIKPRGAVALFGTQPFTSELVMSNRGWFKYEWIWEKNYGSNFATTKYIPMKEHENILIFCSGTTVYNPQKIHRSESGISRAKYAVNPSNTGKRQLIGGLNEKLIRPPRNDETRVPRTLLKFNMETGLHPTQKPIALLSYLIKTYTNEGDRVLDSTCGSGSLLVAAKETGRAAVGIELSSEYCEVAKKRLDYIQWVKDNPEQSSIEANGQITIFAV